MIIASKNGLPVFQQAIRFSIREGQALLLPQQLQHLRQRNLSPFVQFMIGDATDGVEDDGDGVAVHAEGLRGHTSGGDELLGADDSCCFAALFDH